MAAKRQGIIFDLDDTLVDTSDVYWKARRLFISTLASEGVPEDVALDTFESIDTEMIGVYGHTPERYGLSMRESYAKLVESGRLKPNASVETMIVTASSIVIQTVPSLIDGAIPLLDWASKRFELALLTRGVPELQSRKVKERGLNKYFKSTTIVSRKGGGRFFAVDIGFGPEARSMLGDRRFDQVRRQPIAASGCKGDSLCLYPSQLSLAAGVRVCPIGAVLPHRQAS